MSGQEEMYWNSLTPHRVLRIRRCIP